MRFVHKFDPPDLETPLDTTYLPGPGKVFLPYEVPTPQSWVYNTNFEKVEIQNLDPLVFNVEVRKDIVHRVVHWERMAARRETHYVANRSEINKTTRKIAPQKGRGKARHGDRYANIFKGGGKAFGPRGPRDTSHSLQRKVVNLGMKCALSAKYRENNLFILEDTMMDSHKTTNFVEHFQKWGVHRPLLLYAEGELDANFILGVRNLYWFNLYAEHEAPIYEVIRHHEVIITKAALGPLQERLTRITNPVSYVCPPLEELIAAGEITVMGESA